MKQRPRATHVVSSSSCIFVTGTRDFIEFRGYYDGSSSVLFVAVISCM